MNANSIILDLIVPCGLSLLISSLLIYFFIPILRKVKLGQKILEVGPAWHKNKEGTPVMGGLFFITATLLTILFMFAIGRITSQSIFLLINLCFMLLNGAIGFIDDYVKLFKKRNKGLTAWQKLMLQIITTGAYLGVLKALDLITTNITNPFSGNSIDLGIFYYIIVILGIVYMINSANLTDGIDGLAGSIGLIITVLGVAIGIYAGIPEIYILEISIAGSLLGFLIFNFHPAKIFMGDTGSLFLGAALVTLFMRVDAAALILIAGIIYIIEGLSDIIQVFSYKLTKKRIFKMAPIHHHFEMCGWSEVKIVGVFSFITVVSCGLVYYLYVLNY
ncbi:phospho-N-acetylmuramoyl-pentapeptide-transferase [Eubacteriales bacterium OttesenSCG-928-G02]|nr:phospho-N-acetylmuramoyl-pentapeptide-transferase [Eubacteriales bacterium OttesenSCG-928-G02]